MQNIDSDLNTTVQAFYRKYKNTDDKKASLRPEPAEWSLKEIIGHLINSASIYHQRFVGLQTVDEMAFPEYQKHYPEWIGIEKFNDLSTGRPAAAVEAVQHPARAHHPDGQPGEAGQLPAGGGQEKDAGVPHYRLRQASQGPPGPV